MSTPNDVFKVESQDDAFIVTTTATSIHVQESEIESAVEHLHESLGRSPTTNLVVDMGRTTYLGSIMIGSLIALCKKTSDGGGRAVLCNASEGMYDALKIMKLDTVFPYYESRDEALRSLED